MSSCLHEYLWHDVLLDIEIARQFCQQMTSLSRTRVFVTTKDFTLGIEVLYRSVGQENKVTLHLA